MKRAGIDDRQKVINIITQAFINYPTFLFLIRNQKKATHYVSKVAAYVFDFAIRRNGVYLSDSEQGVAIFFKYNEKKKDVLDFFLKLRLIVFALSIRNILKIWRHTHYIERTRPQHGNYLYFWLFGVMPDELPRVSAYEMSAKIFDIANANNIDIYAETVLAKNKLVYERFGFKVYKYWYNPESKFDIWFMRKSVAALSPN